jgi:gluconolactonase
MRTLAVLSLIVIGCGSSESGTTEENDSATTIDDTATTTTDSGTTTEASPDDTATPADSATPMDTAVADTPVDAPDWSKVNPIAGAPMVKKEKGGYGFTEGTAWNTAGGFLLFSDIPNNTIWKLVPPATYTEFRKPSGNSNGLAWDPMGRLIACEHGNRRVSRTNADGMIVTLADKFEGKDLNSPNDAIVRSDGNIYFTDPDYGLDGRPRGVTFKGVYRIDPAGAITAIEKGMNQPNGIALSPDEKILYVADSASPIVNKWNVATDGTVSGKAKFADSGSDGMGMDDAGNLYLTTGGNVRVLKPDGTAWGNISVPEAPANCAFGGADRKTLFIAARTSIYSVNLAIPGKP